MITERWGIWVFGRGEVKMDNYIVIYTSEDGDVSLQFLDKIELLEGLKEDEWGSTEIRNMKDYGTVDLGAKAGLYIIKGKFVNPVPKEVIKKWDIE